MLISIHIPKTAGTTIGYLLDYGFKRRIFYDYGQLEGLRHKKELEEDIQFCSEHREFIEKKFKLIHGHFHYYKYSQVFPEAKYIVCLRDPVARTISQYFHIIEEADPNHWLYENLSTGKMDLVAFSALPNIRRAQSAFTDGRDIEDFDHIFLTEHLAESVHQFQIRFGFQRSDPYMNLEGEASLPNTNPRSARNVQRREFSKTELEQARLMLSEDVELYDKALNKFKKQKKDKKIFNIM